MAMIRKRENEDGTISYQAVVRKLGFPHVSKTFSTKTRAKKWAKRIEVGIEDGNAPSTEASRTTLKEALERYKREVTPKKKGARREQNRVDAWIRHPLAVRFLSQLGGRDFAEYRDQRAAEGKASNTVRIELAMISKLYKIAARDWGMEGLRNPIQSMTMPAGSKERDRRLRPGEEGPLLEQLRKAAGPYMAPLAELAIESAARQGELLALTWADVDLTGRVAHLADTKNGESRNVPLSSRAIEILKALPRPIADSAPLFPISQDEVIKTFRRACVAANIEGLRFHDLRREAVSRLFERGLNLAEVATISGHKTWSQLKRYTELKPEDLAKKLA
jgi:integrase